MAFNPYFKPLVVSLLLAFLFGASASADDLVTSRAVLVDGTGNLDIEDVVKSEFKRTGPILVGGFTDATQWLRITVRAPTDGGTFELRIRPTFLDEVVLYEPNPAEPGAWRQRVTGDRHANPDRPATTLGFLMAPVQEQTTYYLRLKTTSSSLLVVEALTPVDARTDDLFRQLIHVIYLGVMLSMAVLALLGMINLSSRLAAVFLLYLTTQTAAFVALNGYLAYFTTAAHAHWGDTITSILVLGSVATGVLFYSHVFRDYEASSAGLRFLYALLLVFIVELCLMSVGQARLALQINSYVVLILGALTPFVALSMRAGPERERRIICGLVWLQAGALTFMMMPMLGLLSSGVEWIVDAPLSQGLVAAAVMCAILHQRTRGLVEARRRAEIEMKMTHTLLDAERQRAAEQARFMDMLTHELKTPIAAVKMMFELPDASERTRRHALSTLEDMDAVVERCRQLDLLQQGRFTPRRELCQVDALLEEIFASSRAPDRLHLASEPAPDVESDRHLLKIILGNLVDNALKYSAPGSDIDCRIERQESDGQAHVRVSIENQPGPAGLPDPDKLFDKYYRSPLAHRYTGSGLGLYLVRHLAELLEVRLSYDQIHQRARFTLWIPT
ncbi:sensor histidine kinase [Peristeroidobacter soli]|uniref:sensor histidine kinase n=1 Tax=Peristeroidobacter soli TaxID=2497877 RepID=UPI00101C7F9B|nr:7TM-DISM domain-containing protein [Peristeroidobacter soli]